MKLKIPELCLVVLIGPSGAGKSTFAARHFAATEVISSDYCRGLVSDDMNSLEATCDAFDVLKFIAAKRLARGRLTVIDATNVQKESRAPLIEMAREHDVLPVAVVLNLKEEICRDRNLARPDRNFGARVVRSQSQQLRQSLRHLERDGFRYVYVLNDPAEVEAVEFERQPLWNNRKSDHGPFDIIGDIHGCYDELVELLTKLGYAVGAGSPRPPGTDVGAGFPRPPGTDVGAGFPRPPGTDVGAGFPRPPGTVTEDEGGGETPPLRITPPLGRRAIFLGDLVDRGPNSPAVLKLVMSMVAAGTALCVPGNHDAKLARKLQGRDVKIAHGLAETIAQLAVEPPEFSQQVEKFLDKLIGHYVLDDGKLVVAHAGMKQRYIGRASARVRDFALYGETSGETDDLGLPVRHNWAAEYRGPAMVVYGHTPVPEPDWLNHTINIDTGCVFGGKLTALRYPERELVSVPARREYAVPARPLVPVAPVFTAQQQNDDMLDIGDVLGKRIIQTGLINSVTVREENAAAALEVMSRFAVDPRWLIYLPPTISPTETSSEPGLLEHPREAFDYYRKNGVEQVICEEKHMGSRAVVIVCRDESAATKRFGIAGDGAGIIYTRTGRRFFEDRAVEAELLEVIRTAISAADWWDEFQSDWFCLDSELMPWSAKAQELLRNQYAAVGSAATAALSEVNSVLDLASARYSNGELQPLLDQHRQRLDRAGKFVDAYARYCWPVVSPADLKLAPFHLLASEGHVHADRDHLWHMAALKKLADLSSGRLLMATAQQTVAVNDTEQVNAGIAWWESLTADGGEGMVVKPLSFIARGPKGLVQPAMKCRGKEYLRIIYGPEYDAPENLSRLRSRGLATKRWMAAREFALSIESLERFVRREPLRRVHECVFGVLALESEPVDSRL